MTGTTNTHKHTLHIWSKTNLLRSISGQNMSGNYPQTYRSCQKFRLSLCLLRGNWDSLQSKSLWKCVTDKLWHCNAEKLEHASTFPAGGDDAGWEPMQFYTCCEIIWHGSLVPSKYCQLYENWGEVTSKCVGDLSNIVRVMHRADSEILMCPLRKSGLLNIEGLMCSSNCLEKNVKCAVFIKRLTLLCSLRMLFMSHRT